MSLGFSFSPTDEIYVSRGVAGRDRVWDDGEFTAFGNVSLSPAAACFSYGLGIFEGLKAQRAADGRILLFRRRENAKRFRKSAERLLLEPFPEDRFVAAVEELVRRNRRFLPAHGEGSLYLRPMEHGIEPQLGIRPSREFWVLIYASPVGSYFSGSEGLRLKVLEQGRVAPGGCGAAKALGNYAGGIAVARPWIEMGFNDVLYLDARHERFLTETSGSNVFVKLADGPLVTPPLDDQILGGITRDSAIRIARDVLGVRVEERAVSISEALKDGEELFCTGTAWTVRGVRELDFRGRIHEFRSTRLQQAILKQISGIQCGEIDDPHNWITEVSDEA